MPERLDQITIELRSRDVTITSKEWRVLLDELRDRPPSDPTLDRAIREALDKVDASRLVVLTPQQNAYLLRVLEDWSRDVDADEAMPQGLLELQGALVDHLRSGE